MQSPGHSEKSGMHRFESISFHDSQTARLNFERVSGKLSASLARALPVLLAESPDPDSSLLLFDRLVNEASPETVRLIETHPFLAHYAMAVFGNSRYLGETLIQNSDLLQTFLPEKSSPRPWRGSVRGRSSVIVRCSWLASSGGNTCASCCETFSGLLLWPRPRRKFLR